MATFRRGKIVALVEERPGLVRAQIETDGGTIEGAGFPFMLGPLTPGDEVVVNTTGIDLDLGTGNTGFILWNLDGPGPDGPGAGHIVKMRYTPWQTEVLAAEAPESPHHEHLAPRESIDGMPVVACSLHSQVAAAAAGIKATRPQARVGYLMTDGAALPLEWSDLVRDLKAAGLLDITCSAGHAFGGDLESINVFSGLAALRWVGEAHAAIVAMGPGVVGTGTALGFTGMEQGQVLDAAAVLGGRAIAGLRISFADPRHRHHGVSHHSLTALRLAATQRCTVALPLLPPDQDGIVVRQLEEAGIAERHNVVRRDGNPGVALLEDKGLAITSMGRPLRAVPELFLAAAAAGAVAGEDAAPGTEERPV